MKVTILINFEGIAPDDVRRILQVARDVEQVDPYGRTLKIFTLTPELSAADSQKILDEIRPPLPARMIIQTTKSDVG